MMEYTRQLINLKDSNDSREKGTHTQANISRFQSPLPELCIQCQNTFTEKKKGADKEGLNMDRLPVLSHNLEASGLFICDQSKVLQ